MPNQQTLVSQPLIQIENYQSLLLPQPTQPKFLIQNFPFLNSGFSKRPRLLYTFLVGIGKKMGDLNQTSNDPTGDANKDDHKSQDSMPDFSEDEESLVARMFNLVGERWSLIAGRIPGRTAEEIEKYWTSRYSSTEST